MAQHGFTHEMVQNIDPFAIPPVKELLITCDDMSCTAWIRKGNFQHSIHFTNIHQVRDVMASTDANIRELVDIDKRYRPCTQFGTFF